MPFGEWNLIHLENEIIISYLLFKKIKPTKSTTHLITVESLHLQMELTKLLISPKDQQLICGKEDSNFILDVSLIASAAHYEVGNIDRMLGACKCEINTTD